MENVPAPEIVVVDEAAIQTAAEQKRAKFIEDANALAAEMKAAIAAGDTVEKIEAIKAEYCEKIDEVKDAALADMFAIMLADLERVGVAAADVAALRECGVSTRDFFRGPGGDLAKMTAEAAAVIVSIIEAERAKKAVKEEHTRALLGKLADMAKGSPDLMARVEAHGAGEKIAKALEAGAAMDAPSRELYAALVGAALGCSPESVLGVKATEEVPVSVPAEDVKVGATEEVVADEPTA